MSLFNPYVLLGVVLAVLSAFGGGYYKGGEDERVTQELEIATLNAQARQKEQALTAAVNAQASQLTKATQNAKLLQAKRNTDIDSGALRLRVPVQSPVCAVSTAPDATPAPRDSVQASAELDRETAKALIAITDQGDANTRQLNACIDAYNTAFQAINQRNKP
jgi:prophage endopeptidase